jgi:hypothetical protein
MGDQLPRRSPLTVDSIQSAIVSRGVSPRKRIARRAQRSDEDVGATAIGHRHGGTGEINEQLLTDTMHLPH